MMARLGKSALLATFVLLSAADAGGGLDEACKKTPNPGFCVTLLQPKAAEFSEGDPKKIGFAAIDATIGKVQEVKTYMLGKAVKSAKNKELKGAIMDCVEQIARSEGTLKLAVGDLDNTNAPRKLGKPVPVSMIDTASMELMKCHDALKKSEAAGMAAGGENADVTRQALRSAEESVLACYIAKALVTP